MITASDMDSVFPKAEQKESTVDFAAWILRLSVESNCKIAIVLLLLMPLIAFFRAAVAVSVR
jgi:hypothetical protein